MALGIPEPDIGGARVNMTFNHSGKIFRRGEHMSAAEVRSIAPKNRDAAESAGFIRVYARGGERFIVAVAKDKFNVIEGRRLNDKPLTREEADALARAK